MAELPLALAALARQDWSGPSVWWWGALRQASGLRPRAVARVAGGRPAPRMGTSCGAGQEAARQRALLTRCRSTWRRATRRSRRADGVDDPDARSSVGAVTAPGCHLCARRIHRGPDRGSRITGAATLDRGARRPRSRPFRDLRPRAVLRGALRLLRLQHLHAVRAGGLRGLAGRLARRGAPGARAGPRRGRDPAGRHGVRRGRDAVAARRRAARARCSTPSGRRSGWPRARR